MQNTDYKVYIKTDENQSIIAIEGGLYPPHDTTGWTEIDSGTVYPKYVHPQGNYLPLGLRDKDGCYNYKFIGGQLAERTAEEKQQEIALRPAPPKTAAEEIAELKQLVADLASLQLGV